MKTQLAALGAGLLFGAGLCLAGMTQPAKIIGFLDFAGAWDPSLLLVMIGALAVHAPLSWLIRRRPAPLWEPRFHLPERRAIDSQLVAGAALFGVGWGLGGFCPGPALVALATAAPPALIFVCAMALGMMTERALSPHHPH